MNAKIAVVKEIENTVKIIKKRHHAITRFGIKKNRDKVIKRQKSYRENNKEIISEIKKQWYGKHRDVVNKKHKIYRENNKERMVFLKNRWLKKNIEYASAKRKKRYDENRESIIRKTTEYQRKKRLSDPSYRIIGILRVRLRLALKANNAVKSSKTLDIIGCTAIELKEYIKKQFTEGMSWDNYGVHGWHIDHIRPCSSFDLNDPEQQKVCFHFSNLQPLWANDNLTKSSKWEK